MPRDGTRSPEPAGRIVIGTNLITPLEAHPMMDEARGHVLALLERFGVPVAILAVILWFTREAAVSLHATVLVPVVNSHTEFLEMTQETLLEIGRAQEKQAEAMKELCVGQQQLQHAITDRWEDGVKGKN